MSLPVDSGPDTLVDILEDSKAGLWLESFVSVMGKGQVQEFQGRTHELRRPLLEPEGSERDTPRKVHLVLEWDTGGTLSRGLPAPPSRYRRGAVLLTTALLTQSRLSGFPLFADNF